MIDHLVRFETFYMEAFIYNLVWVLFLFVVLCGFFFFFLFFFFLGGGGGKLEKAYNITWKYGIMKTYR